MITTCPSALKQLTAKNNLYGEQDSNQMGEHMINQQVHSSSAITFTPEFVKYYFGNKYFSLFNIIKPRIYLFQQIEKPKYNNTSKKSAIWRLFSQNWPSKKANWEKNTKKWI